MARTKTTMFKDNTKSGKSTFYFFAITAVIAVASMLPVRFVTPQENPGETFSLDLKNADISSLIEIVSNRTGRNFIVDPRVKATVNVVSSEPVDADKLYEIFLSVLEVHGFAAVQTGQMTKIIPSSVGVQSAVPLLSEPSDTGDELVSHVIRLENAPAHQVVETLGPLISESASVTAESISNTVVITDRAANIERLVKLITVLDGR